MNHFAQFQPEVAKQYPWYRKDKFGWPIETWEGKPFKSFVRIVFQNIRKITG